MNKITPDHLTRSAYVYGRQSTPDQLANNPESRRRQYALADRARVLGWENGVVIDDDLGRSGGGTARPGFERLVTSICTGTAGAVLAIEASRLARNGRDWHLVHQLCGLLPSPRSGRQRVDVLDHALDALLRWPVPQVRLSGSRRVHPPKRVPQEVELPFRYLADSCLLIVDRELQLTHDLAQSLQGLFGFAPPAQDHESVSVGHDPRAEASLQPEHLPSQHKPAHVEIRQQW